MKKKKLFIILGLLLLGTVLYFVFFKNKTTVEYTTVSVKRGNLVQSVSEVGSVKAVKELELNFNQVGKLAKILVKNGDVVVKDQPLAELDYSSLLIKQREAQSSVEVSRANLNKLLAGAAASDIAVYSSQVDQAKVAYSSAVADFTKAQSTLNENLNQLQVKVNDLNSKDNIYYSALIGAQDSLVTTIDAKNFAANNALDYVSRITSDKDIDDVLSVKNMSYLNDANMYYAQAGEVEAAADLSLLNARRTLSAADLALAVSTSLDYLSKAFKSANNCFNALESSVISPDLTQSELDVFKSTMSTNLTAVNSGVAAVQAADYSYKNAKINLSEAQKTAANNLSLARVNGEQQLASAQSRVDTARQSWDVAQKQLDKIKTTARPEDIALARGQLASAEASLDLVKKQIADNVILAPINGQIANINYEIGEQVSAAKAAIVMLTENNFEIEVDIPESDISKVKINDAVSMTFDAFGEKRKFNGVVAFIDPAATSIQNVIYYKVKVVFTDAANILSDIKSGMTANVTITTNNKQEILIIPSRALVDKNGQGKFVRILVDVKKNTIKEIPVTVGLSGDDGLVEILSGDIKEGDSVVTFVKDLTK